MKTQTKFSTPSIRLIASLFIVFLVACSSEEAEPEYIPSIGAWWLDSDNTRDYTHSITWSYHPDVSSCPNPFPCFNEGSFGGNDGYRSTPSGDSKTCSIKGSFRNHHIEWTYPDNDANRRNGCPIIGASYSGTIDGATITVSSPTLGNLILKQH